MCVHAYTPVTFQTFIWTKYAERDVVYDRSEARKGRLRAVAIKSLYLVDVRHTGSAFRVLYIDTLNGWWNEADLVPHAEAIALATAYWQHVADVTENLIQETHGNCRFDPNRII